MEHNYFIYYSNLNNFILISIFIFLYVFAKPLQGSCWQLPLALNSYSHLDLWIKIITMTTNKTCCNYLFENWRWCFSKGSMTYYIIMFSIKFLIFCWLMFMITICIIYIVEVINQDSSIWRFIDLMLLRLINS